MFEILYKDPATIERYRLAPLLEDRERYLCAVVASGVVGDVARRVARTQLALMDLLNLPDTDIPVGFATVEAAVQGWCRNVPAVSAADFRRHAFRWLRFLGWLEESVRDAHPHARQVEAFAAWMRDDRGLSEATIGNCCYESDRLFAWAACCSARRLDADRRGNLLIFFNSKGSNGDAEQHAERFTTL